MHTSRELAEHEPILTEHLARRRDRRRQIYRRLIIAGSLSTIVTMITACGDMAPTSDRTTPAATTTSTSDSSTDVSRQTDAAVLSPTVTGVGSPVVGQGAADAVPELLGLGSLPQDGAQGDLSVPEQSQVVVPEPGSSTPGGEVLVESHGTRGQAGSPVNGVPYEVASRLPSGLATILTQVDIV
jgi:hypothetical protein